MIELYTRLSYQTAKRVTLNYSTSFGQSSKLFSSKIRPHIYAIYGLVRVADEVVDTYRGDDRGELLDALEHETLAALQTGFSTNLLVQAFATTARQYKISSDLIMPFFTSMRMDLRPQRYDERQYATYIEGSAEVIGLMCLKVFCPNPHDYTRLEASARALGAAYQKVNFLRDCKADFEERGRVYFPGIQFDSFSETEKQQIIDNIKEDFTTAQVGIESLPAGARRAVHLSFRYYSELLARLDRATIMTIKAGRLRISTPRKLWLLALSFIHQGHM